MNRLKSASLFSFLALGSAVLAAAAPLKIELKNPEGKVIGEATLTQLKHGVKIALQAHDLTPGEHAFHVHEKGECKAPDFKSAGAHFDSDKHKHGFDFAGGPHSGDMPNLVVSPDGTGRAEVINTQVTLEKGPNSLLKDGGTALVIHAKPDDYRSQPAGDAGDRVACGEIRR